MNDQEREDAIFQFMKQETSYLPDAGFSEQVMKSLPVSRGFRLKVLTLSWFMAVCLGPGLWWNFGGNSSVSFVSFSWPVILSTAFLAFWLMFALLVYVLTTERVIEFE